MTCHNATSLYSRRLSQRRFRLSLLLRRIVGAFFGAGQTGLGMAAMAAIICLFFPIPAHAQETTPVYIKKDVKGDHYLYWFTHHGELTSNAVSFAKPEGDGFIHTDLPSQYKRPGAVLEVLNTDTNMVARLPLVYPPGSVTVSDADFTYVRTLPVTFKNAGGNPVRGLMITLKYYDKYWPGETKQQYWLSAKDGGVAHFTDVPTKELYTIYVYFNSNSQTSEDVPSMRPDASGGYSYTFHNLPWPGIPTTSGARQVNLPPIYPRPPTEIRNEGLSSGTVAGLFAGFVGLALVALCMFWLVDSGRLNGMLAKMGIQVAPTAQGRPVMATGPSPMPSPTRRVAPRPISNEAVTSLIDEASIGGSGPRLVATLGPYAGSIFSLAEPIVAVGRDVDNTVALTQDSATSRRHAHIQTANGQYILTDDGSSNGTYVNGVRIASKKPQTLRPGDEVQIGTTRFRFEA